MRRMMFVGLVALAGCSEADDTSDSAGGTNAGSDTGDSLGGAWAEFSDNVVVYADGDDIVIETNGLPDHTSPYWSPDHELHVEATVGENLAPGFIDNFNGSFTLRVPANPVVAANSSATGLGPIGIARSGSVTYNDEEGPGIPLDNAAPSLDYTGAHTGPQSYHYHLETKAWSDDDDALIGVMSDGFMLYGRRCAETGDYPQDLDASGGHTGRTQFSDEESYHYHIMNELYLGEYYILFPEDFQGTPNNIQ